jgi:imidazoleglycerol-phosphate dehydratase
MSKVQRETRETNITLEVKRGSGAVKASTGEPFLDHMLVTLGRYAGLDLTISATGDLRHHLIEDVAITLGLALAQEVPAQAERYGWALVPMDEALAQAAVDVGGGPSTRERFPRRSTSTSCNPSRSTSERRSTCGSSVGRTVTIWSRLR